MHTYISKLDELLHRPATMWTEITPEQQPELQLPSRPTLPMAHARLLLELKREPLYIEVCDCYQQMLDGWQLRKLWVNSRRRELRAEAASAPVGAEAQTNEDVEEIVYDPPAEEVDPLPVKRRASGGKGLMVHPRAVPSVSEKHQLQSVQRKLHVRSVMQWAHSFLRGRGLHCIKSATSRYYRRHPNVSFQAVRISCHPPSRPVFVWVNPEAHHSIDAAIKAVQSAYERLMAETPELESTQA